MKFLSVCSGIEAASVAWKSLGWEPVGFSEIEKFPSAVLEHHYPDVPNFGDMNDYRNWPDTEFDVLVGGTPCQSFSVAGLRGGLADPRGNLALIYLAIAERYRPRWLVWENVPGVLSSHGGRDFGSIIGGMVELGYSPSWRVLDAKNFGVPQRRRRVFVVASAGGWRDSAEVLFEPSCMCGYCEESGEERKETAGTVAPCIEANDGPKWGSNQWVDNGKAIVCPQTANPLTRRMYKGINTTVDEGQTPIVVHGTQDPCVSDIAHPLQAKNGGSVNAVAFAENQRGEVREMANMPALNAGGGKPGSGYPAIRTEAHGIPGNWIGRKPENGGNATQFPHERAPSLTSTDRHGVISGMAVRRLTPVECERLQGFPDGYTEIPGGSDTARYKALGNSMAVPVMRWIGDRISRFSSSRVA